MYSYIVRSKCKWSLFTQVSDLDFEVEFIV